MLSGMEHLSEDASRTATGSTWIPLELPSNMVPINISLAPGLPVPGFLVLLEQCDDCRITTYEENLVVRVGHTAERYL